MRLHARVLTLTVLAGSLLPAGAAHARLFWQTYGSTVPTAQGCVWNLNQDYFVPRHCDSCRYGLFSACKTAHTISPACKNLHPVYGGYCTPYGACRYRWRDHVYKKYCCCTPLRHTYGPWHLERCRKHGCAACDAPTCDRGQCAACGYGAARPAVAAGDFAACGSSADWDDLPNVESMEVETLGAIDALGTMSAAAMSPMGGATRPTVNRGSQPAANTTMPPLPAGILPFGAGGDLNVPVPAVN